MALSLNDKPNDDKPAAKAEKKEEKSDSSEALRAAAQSSDAAVHNLLGHREIAERNEDKDELKRIDKELAELLNL